MVAPGLAGLETVLTLHDAARIGSPHARWGVTEGNPIHDDVRAIAAATGTDFALDVLLDRERRIAAAFGGELLAMHREACRAAGAIAMRPVAAPFDVVVTSNAGFPLDQNLYQAVKGMSAAAQVVKPGGLIVCAAECRDGFPSHGSYRRSSASADSPQALLAEDHRSLPDRPRSVAGADPGRHPDASAGGRSHVVPDGRGARGGTPRADRRRRGTASPRQGPRRGCACCPRARRRSPTSPDRCTSSRRPTSFATR